MAREFKLLRHNEIHERFVEALDGRVVWSSDVESKPLEIDLVPPLPSQVRLYAFNLTHPPGGRTTGEHKIQLIIPGQTRGERGNFDLSGGRIVLLSGYEPETDVFVLWDSGMYPDFPYSCNVQVRAETVYAAYAGQIAEQERALRGRGIETVIATKADRLDEAIRRRADLSLRRLLDW